MFTVDDFLTFSNAALVAFSFWTVCELAEYLHRKAPEWGGFIDMFGYMRRAWLRLYNAYGEFAIAFTAVTLGIFIRGSTLLSWRIMGHGPFPYIFGQIGDCLAYAGFLCIIRCLGDKGDGSPNRRWKAAIGFALLFATSAVILKRSIV